MKPQANFLIKHYEYFDERGKRKYEYYYIQECKKFLWWPYWKDIKHEEHSWSDCYKTRTTFATLEDAQKFVREVLCPEKPRDRYRVSVVDKMVCKKVY